MIKSVTSSSPHIYSTGGGTSFPYVSYNPGNPAQGMLRVNGSDMEVFDGSTWMKIYMNNADIGLNNNANEAINWAIKRMREEEEWYKLASSNEAVRIALEQLEQARTRLELTAHLAREYDTETTS
jgi:dipeptidase